MKHIEAMELALDWFKCYKDKSMSRNNAEELADEAITAIKQALTAPTVHEPKQSPPFTFRRFVAGSERAQDVAVHREVTLDAAIRVAAKICPPSESGHPTVLVYTPPAHAQPAVPLTDEQIYAIGKELGMKCRLGGNSNIDLDYARAIETAHGITKKGQP